MCYLQTSLTRVCPLLGIGVSHPATSKGFHMHPMNNISLTMSKKILDLTDKITKSTFSRGFTSIQLVKITAFPEPQLDMGAIMQWGREEMGEMVISLSGPK